MNSSQIVSEVEKELREAVSHFQDEAKKIRTGRAHPSMVETLPVSVYGATMPLFQAATISTPEAQLIQISPFDPNNLQAIVEAIRNDQSLGFNPTDDGRVIRIPVPSLTTERRQQLVKQLHEKTEEAFIAMRQARHEGLHNIKSEKDAKNLSEDEASRTEKQIDDLMNKFKIEIEGSAKSREQEILTV